MSTKEVIHVVTAHRQTEGGGFVVRRPVPTAGLELVDPFLLIDEMGPIDYAPGEAVGAPDHPHRGFETITYALAGEFEHEDSAGHAGKLAAGDVQWMTAGGGIVHSEEPSQRIRDQGGRVHGFQIWVNLPAKLKMTQPRYQEVKSAAIPRAETPDGRARVKVIAGSALGVDAVIDTHTPVAYQDWTLDVGGDASVTLDHGERALVYVFGGSARIGDEGRVIRDGQLAILGDGATVRLRGPELDRSIGRPAKQGWPSPYNEGPPERGPDTGEPARLLLLAGTPLHEPVARYGPFVMNTRDELIQAFEDYQSGRMGEITRTARVA